MLSKEGNTHIQLAVPQEHMTRVHIFAINPQLVDHIVKEATRAFTKIKIEVDPNVTIDNGVLGKEVQLHKLSGMDRHVGLWIFAFLLASGWEVQQAIAVMEGRHIVYHMKANEVGIQNK